MGFPDGGVGDMGGMRATDLIGQMRSIVDSDLVAEDAKLDLVADYGSDQTVSHHGSWSRLPSSSDARRSREIRTAFANALGSVAGEKPESAGSAALDDIIRKLLDNKKPLTKREVRQVLSAATPFIDIQTLKNALSKDVKSCKSLSGRGNDLQTKVDDFEKKLQNAKVSFTKQELEGFKQSYASAQELRAQITKDYNAVFKTMVKGVLTPEEVLTVLDQKKDTDASGKPDDSLKEMTFNQLVDEKNRLAKELQNLPKGDKAANGAKSDPKAQETKARYRAVVGELRQILRARVQEAEKTERSIPQEIRDQLAVKKETYQPVLDEVQQKKEQFLKQYRAVYPDANKDISFEDAIKNRDDDDNKVKVPESLKGIEEMSLQQLKDKKASLELEVLSEWGPDDLMWKSDDPESNEKKVETWRDKDDDGKELKDLKDQIGILEAVIKQKTMQLKQETLQHAAETAKQEIAELENSIPKNVREAIANGTELQPDLDRFLKPGNEAEGDVADFAVGAEATRLRSELLTEIESLKAELKSWTASQKKTGETAGKLLSQEPWSDDKTYADDCRKCQKSIQRQKDALETLQKKLDDLQARYDATFVAPRKFAEAAKKQEEVSKIKTEVDNAAKEIAGLKKQIETLKATKQKLIDAGGKEAEKSHDEAKHLVSAMQALYRQKLDKFEGQRILPSKDDDKALHQLQKEIGELKSRIESNEKLIEEKWTKPIQEQEGKIAEKNLNVEEQKKKIDKMKEQTKVGLPRRQEVESSNGTFRIGDAWLRNENGGVTSTEIDRAIKENVFDKIDGFKDWFASECLNKTCEMCSCGEGLAKDCFVAMWKNFKLEALADLVRKSLVSEPSNGPDICLGVDRVKEIVASVMTGKFYAEGFDKIDPAEAKLKGLTEGKDGANPALDQLNKAYGEWKNRAFKSAQTVLGKESFDKLGQTIKGDYDRLVKAVSERSLSSLAFGSDEDRTIFNHLVDFLTKEGAGDDSLFAVVEKDFKNVVDSYSLVDQKAGNIESKLTLPAKGKDEPRLRQGEKDGPGEIIANVLKKNPKVGLIQEGGNSCWMISVVNGLLTSEKGVKILQECFKDPEKCVFKARTNDGKTQPIEVSKGEIDKLMQKKGAVSLSRLEAAIWLGVRKMSENRQLFDVKGCGLGAMGEATETATLFGLRNVETGDGKSASDNDSVWVGGANALYENKLVVLHRGVSVNSGHFMTVVGTTLKESENAAPEKTFHVNDSLQNDPTVTLSSANLNANRQPGMTGYKVLAFDLPARREAASVFH